MSPHTQRLLMMSDHRPPPPIRDIGLAIQRLVGSDTRGRTPLVEGARLDHTLATAWPLNALGRSDYDVPSAATRRVPCRGSRRRSDWGWA